MLPGATLHAPSALSRSSPEPPGAQPTAVYCICQFQVSGKQSPHSSNVGIMLAPCLRGLSLGGLWRMRRLHLTRAPNEEDEQCRGAQRNSPPGASRTVYVAYKTPAMRIAATSSAASKSSRP